ncbi:MAG: NAD(P)/FAD-dependent oxidoreductase [Acidobacteriaceae bacterium]
MPAQASEHSFDVLVLGAGAAGLMCALVAAQRGRRVAVLDRAERIGKKILISGGGRCNFTNLYCTAENFLSANPHFARSALARYTPSDFIALVEKHGIAYHEKTLGQLFCDRSATQIVDMLEQECRSAGVRFFLAQHIVDVQRDAGFLVRSAQAGFRSAALIVATGGLSIPKMGATAFGYTLAQQFGLALEPTRPALVPLTFAPADLERFGALSGISTEVTVVCADARFREKLLFTHRGLSGPAILQISSYWTDGSPLRIDLAPDRTWTDELRVHSGRRDATAAKTALRRIFPQRLAERWFDLHPPPDWTNRSLTRMEEQVHRWEPTPAGTEGFEKAEVTAGGVATSELSPQTLESRRVPGLFFIGEVVDVTGHLGGHNFQWAWASGAAAGAAV